MEFFNLLLGTILLRPYVFVFLAAYLYIAISHIGLKRTVIFTVVAYSIAFLSEYSSTRNGFPYGFYSYIETTRHQELWVSNVPFMDSLSYTFLTYIAYTMSLMLRSPLSVHGWDVRRLPHPSVDHSLKTVALGAFLFMLMDVVIDPVAFRGDQWFLGKIYTYKEQGEYFNIPLTNFGGWLLVGGTVLLVFTRIDRWLGPRTGPGDIGIQDKPGQALLGPAVYFGVLAFNLAVTFYIGEFVLGLCGIFLTLVIAGVLFYKIKNPNAFT